MRISYLDYLQAERCESADWLPHFANHLLRHFLRKSDSGSAIVPIQKARMQWQEPHPFDQHCNQGIFARRWNLQDIPRLQPMRMLVADTGADCDLISPSYARLRSLDRHPDRGLRNIRTLRCHESRRLKQIALLHCCYAFQSLGSGAVPAYDARLSRRRQLNALRRREDDSQCSELKEWERHNWCMFSMALVVMGIDGSDTLLHPRIYHSVSSDVTEGAFFVERSGHVRRYGFGVASRIAATCLAIFPVGEDVL